MKTKKKNQVKTKQMYKIFRSKFNLKGFSQVYKSKI